MIPPQAVLRVPMQSRAHRTRAALVAAAAVEFAERGYAKTTAKSIAQRADVAVGSFYQYFPNKDEMLHELARGRGQALSRAALAPLSLDARVQSSAPPHEDAVRAVLREIVTLVIAHHREDKALHAVLTERRHADPRLDRTTTRWEQTMVSAVAERIVAWGRAPDPQAAAFVAYGAIEGAVHAHVLGEARVDDARLCATLIDAVMAIVLPPASAFAPTS